MKIDEMIASLNEEIAKMTEAREMLERINGKVVEAAKRGRPKGSGQNAAASAPAKRTRNMSPEAKARIAEAQRRRWAAQKSGGSAKKSTGAKKGAAKKAGQATEPAAAE